MSFLSYRAVDQPSRPATICGRFGVCPRLDAGRGQERGHTNFGLDAALWGRIGSCFMDDGLNSPEITQEAKPISPYAAAWTTFNQRLCRSLWMRLPRPEWRGQPIVGYHLFISTSSSDSGTGVPPWCEPGNDGRSRRRVRSASRRQAVVNQPGGFAPMSPGSKAGPQSQPLRAAVNVEGRPLPQMPRRPVGTVIRAGSDGAGSTRVSPGSSRPDALTGQPGAAGCGRV